MTIELLSVQQNRNTFFDIQIIEKECLTHDLNPQDEGRGGRSVAMDRSGWNNESRIVALNETKL